MNVRLSGMRLGCTVDFGCLDQIAVGTVVGQAAKLPRLHATPPG